MYLVEKLARRSVSLLVAAMTLVACTQGGTENRADPSGPSGPEAIAFAPYAQRFAAIIGPFETARDSFESASGALRTGATAGDFVLIASPFADVVAKSDVELRQVTWPGVALGDIKAELDADKSLRAELLGTLDDTLIASLWRRQIITAANRARNAARIVSIDLGLLLPPSARTPNAS